ncbi:MAG: hypothetical protein KatS3mg115_2545 [Candidatus Poribacteria bacterium]|nr:MAG: hypothetical protein KatS3mg115_2545 [Candidatus Poribacteria bacterium]
MPGTLARSLRLLLWGICFLLLVPAWGEWFNAARLLSVPTAEIPEGGHFSLHGEAGWRGNRLRERSRTGVELSVSLGGRLLAGAAWEGLSASDERLTGRIGLLAVPAKGRRPALALWATQLGSPEENSWAVLSQEWNLPRIGFFWLHGGARLRWTKGEKEENGQRLFPFGGIEKRFRIGSEQARLGFVWTGTTAQVGGSLWTRRGAVVGLLYDFEQRELGAVLGFDPSGWEQRLEEIERLAKQAVRIATEPD